jgi:hypothetical protein
MAIADCPCLEIPRGFLVTDNEGELLVYDDITEVTHRCRLCGAKKMIRHVPGDFSRNGDGEHASKGCGNSLILTHNRDIGLQEPADRIEERFGKWEAGRDANTP